MKAVIVYDTVSDAKVTGKVAETIAGCLTANGVPVDSYFVGDVAKVDLKAYDCLIIGAPTMAWRPSARMKEYLSGLKAKPISGSKAATFDTQMRSAFSGNATKHMEKRLVELGMEIVVPSLLAYVQSEDRAYHLREGETQHIMTWCKELAGALGKA